MSCRPPLPLVVVFLLVGLGAFAQRQAHVLGVQHEWCAEHAAFTHVTCEDRAPELSGSHCDSEHAPLQHSGDEEEHEHCSWLLLDKLETQSAQAGSGVLVDLGRAFVRSVPNLPQTPSGVGVPLLALAPKNSPPL